MNRSITLRARAGTGTPPAGYALSVAAGGCLSREALSTQAGRPAAASSPAVRAAPFTAIPYHLVA